jgi:transcriptional regulator with XRE-family HTH domain
MIGERIRERRQELGLSLRALAEEVDLTASFLSQIERAQAEPSIRSLRKIADALGVSLFYFLAEDEAISPVVRRDERRRLQLPGSKVICELLTPSIRRKMEALFINADPARGNIAQPLPEPTEECIVVFEGRLSVGLDDEEYILEPGDSIYFEGSRLRSLSAMGDKQALFLSAMTPAVF